MSDGEMNFFSVGIDGKVNNWILLQTDFAATTIITLFLDKDPVPGADGTLVKLKSISSAALVTFAVTFFCVPGCASCVKFHPTKTDIYLVGTEEGLIYKCSTEYSSAYLMTYKAHTMPVHRIDYNKLNSDIFASCSADWRVKIWEDNRQ